MSDSDPEAPDSGEAAGKDPGDDLGKIRSLLFGQEEKKLTELQEKFENPALHAREVGKILPESVTIANAEGERLTEALTPTIETALSRSVKRNPAVLVDAIFPVIGPAIRKSIAETFAVFVQSFNKVLEHSLSVQGLKWRLEAARTGRSFAEVVLYHTLVYRVEQVFLIHKHTGLLLQHVVSGETQTQDPDLVSGMMTAIQDFVRDSFSVQDGEALKTMQVGELTVWIETGPAATLAAVIRGQAPLGLRDTLQTALEKIHDEQVEQLDEFEGDTAPFGTTVGHLESCLALEFGEQPKQSSAKMWILLLVVLLGVGFILYPIFRDRHRWGRFVDRISAEQGLVVIEAGREKGRFHVRGLRDPMALDPQTLVEEFRLDPEEVMMRWEPYLAITPDLVLKRAEAVLGPPAGVALTLEGGVLSARGDASREWKGEARIKATGLAGVEAFVTDPDPPVPEPPSPLEVLPPLIERTIIFFTEGMELAEGGEELLGAVGLRIGELQRAALVAGRTVRIKLTGHSDASGSPAYNLRLSQERARRIYDLLLFRGALSTGMVFEGAGAARPLREGMSLAEQVHNRRVTFSVEVDPAP